jgi:hypothetical protein
MTSFRDSRGTYRGNAISWQDPPLDSAGREHSEAEAKTRREALPPRDEAGVVARAGEGLWTPYMARAGGPVCAAPPVDCRMSAI